MIEFVDTHCHIQEAAEEDTGDAFVQSKWAKGGFLKPDELITEAIEKGISQLVCVGCTLQDSEMAVELAKNSQYCVASIGIHPHEAKHYTCDAPTCFVAEQQTLPELLAQRGVEPSSTPSPYQTYASVRASGSPSAASKHKHNVMLREFTKLAQSPKVVAIGECGLDYYYEHSPKEQQVEILVFQLELAKKYNLPVIFHVREAYDDFWPIFDEFRGLKGVIHSFSSNIAVLEQILSRGLYVGLNGIMTFTNDQDQLAAAKHIPLENLVLETDAPFLTPTPYRGTICQPKHVVDTAKFLAELRQESLEDLAKATTQNAKKLFNL
jgi:TatD DNase family protein